MKQAVVLAGGLGTRLRKAVPDCPKPMAPVAGRPFLEMVLDYLQGQGVHRVVLAVSYGREQIQRHFANTWGNLRIDYSVELDPLGTGGAIRQALALCDEGAVTVVNGDTYFGVDLPAMHAVHAHAHAHLSLAVRQEQDCARYGRVLLDEHGERVRGFAEKQPGAPGWINGGCYVIDRNAFASQSLPKRFSFEQDYLPQAVEKPPYPLAFPSDAHFIDIGIPEDWGRAQAELMSLAGGVRGESSSGGLTFSTQ